MRPCLSLCIAIAPLILLGCSHTLLLKDVEKYSGTCAFEVIDERPDQEHIYVRGADLVKVAIKPPLAHSIRNTTCANVDPTLDATLYIQDYDCMVDGFFNITYIVDFRAKLKIGIKEEDIRVSNKIVSSTGYIPLGCENASSTLITDITDRIKDAILHISTK